MCVESTVIAADERIGEQERLDRAAAAAPARRPAPRTTRGTPVWKRKYMKRAKKKTCETRRAHLRITAMRRGGMPLPGSFDFLAFAAAPSSPPRRGACAAALASASPRPGSAPRSAGPACALVASLSRPRVAPSRPDPVGARRPASGSTAAGERAPVQRRHGPGVAGHPRDRIRMRGLRHGSDLLHAEVLPAHRPEAALLAHRRGTAGSRASGR